MTVTVRYFAAAAEAAGTAGETVTAATVGGFRQEAANRHGERMAVVLAQCALLLEGVRVGDDASLPEGSTLDVLPPFAGG